MRFIRGHSLALLLWAALPDAALAQQPAQAPSVQEGMFFAYRWCYTCHRDSQRGAPTFEQLVGARDITVEYLKRYTENPGHRMLKFELAERDLENLRAYMASLASPPR